MEILSLAERLNRSVARLKNNILENETDA